MGLEAFPEIESFQKLPRQVIVKGGSSTFDERHGAILRGIVINNIGHPICDLRVQVIVMNDNGIPLLSSHIEPDPSLLEQGQIGSFMLQIKDHPKRIADYHLYTHWRFDERE